MYFLMSFFAVGAIIFLLSLFNKLDVISVDRTKSSVLALLSVASREQN